MFDGRVCVVTGGAGGIGKELVLEFAGQGANVAFIDIDKEAGRRLEEDIKKQYGVGALFFHGDINSEEDAELFAGTVIGQYDKIDYLVNNGCADKWGKDKDEVLQAGIDSGVIAPYRMITLFQNYFYIGGCVVNIAANGEAKQHAEDALTVLTRKMAESLQGRVRVNCVSPGRETAKVEKSACGRECLKSVGEPFDITKTVTFLCEGKSDFINGKNITVDGGMTKMMVYYGEGGWSFQ